MQNARKSKVAEAAAAPAPEPKLSPLAARAEKFSLNAERAALRVDAAKEIERDARIVFADALTNGDDADKKLMQAGWERDLKRVNSAVRSAKNRREEARVATKQAERFDRLRSGDITKLTKSDLFTRLETIAQKFARPSGMSRDEFKDALKDARDNAKPNETPADIVTKARRGNKTPTPAPLAPAGLATVIPTALPLPATK